MESGTEPRIQLHDHMRIKIIGNSIAAGRGSSDCAFDGEYILKTDGRKYYRQTGQKNWGAVLQRLLREKYPHLEVINNACNSMNSHQIHKYIDTLVEPEDDLVLIMLGSSDRKLPGGMSMLCHDLRHILNFCRDLCVSVLLLTPCPSTFANEFRGDKIYHMDDVNYCIKDVAQKKQVPCLSFYDLILEWLENQHITLSEFMQPADELDEYGLPKEERIYSVQDWDRFPDGMHPPDSVQELMARLLIREMGWLEDSSSAEH